MFEKPKFREVRKKSYKNGEITVKLCAKYEEYFVSISTSKGRMIWVWATDEEIREFSGYFDAQYRAGNKIYRELTLKKCLEILRSN